MHTCQFSYLSRNETAPLRFDPVALWFLTQCCRAPLLGLTQWRRRSVLTQCCRAPAPAIHLEPFLGTYPLDVKPALQPSFFAKSNLSRHQIQPLLSLNPAYLVTECNLSRCPPQPSRRQIQTYHSSPAILHFAGNNSLVVKKLSISDVFCISCFTNLHNFLRWVAFFTVAAKLR